MDLKTISFVPSPNFSQGRGGRVPEIIVLHCPVGTMKGTIATFQNGMAKVSAHYVVDRDGSVVQMVSLADTAWHVMNANKFAIGIEMVDRYLIDGIHLSLGCMRDRNWMTTKQMQAVADLVTSLMKEFNIPLLKVMGHNDQYLKQFGNNHQDPGPYWPWFNFRNMLTELIKPVVPVPTEPVQPPVTEVQQSVDNSVLSLEMIKEAQTVLLNQNDATEQSSALDALTKQAQELGMYPTPRKKRGRKIVGRKKWS